MSCTITEGIARGCRDNAGGVYQFYIASYPAGLSVSKTSPSGETYEEIVDIDTDSSPTIFYEFIPNKNSSEFTETYQVSLENGTVGYEQKATMVFSKMEADKANQIKMLATGDVLVIIKDKNGRYFLMGENEGAQLSGGNAGTGKALTDLNGYSLELTAMEGSHADEIAGTSIVTSVSGQITVTSA